MLSCQHGIKKKEIYIYIYILIHFVAVHLVAYFDQLYIIGILFRKCPMSILVHSHKIVRIYLGGQKSPLKTIHSGHGSKPLEFVKNTLSGKTAVINSNKAQLVTSKIACGIAQCSCVLLFFLL